MFKQSSQIQEKIQDKINDTLQRTQGHQEDNTGNSANTVNIINAIQDEHKYTLMMVSVLKDQLADYDIGKTPDYNMLFDMMNYMADFPKKFNHSAKAKFINAVINQDPENNNDLENLLAEKKQITDFNKQVIAALKSLIKEHSILKEEELKMFAKNYVELIESHIDTEQKVLFVRAEAAFSADELNHFYNAGKIDIKHLLEQDLPTLFEEGYKDISEEMAKRWEEIEDAANDFALAEFVSLGALFESIEPLSLSATEIGKIIKEFSYNMYLANRECYGDLLFKSQDNKSDYLEKPISTALNCYEEYINGMSKIGEVLKNAKGQVYEPYESRKAFYHANHSSAKTQPSDKQDVKSPEEEEQPTPTKTKTSKASKANSKAKTSNKGKASAKTKSKSTVKKSPVTTAKTTTKPKSKSASKGVKAEA